MAGGERATDQAWANRMLLLKAEESLSERGQHRLDAVFSMDDPSGNLQAAWQVKEQLCALLNTGSIQDVSAAKNSTAGLMARAAMRPPSS